MAIKIDELFYELELRSKGFRDGLTDATKAAGEFTAFVKKHPLAVTAALGAAFTTVAAIGAAMAKNIDASLKRAEAAFPGVRGQITGIREDLRRLALLTGRSQLDLADGFAQVVSVGVQSVGEARTFLAAAVDAADASGEDLSAVIDGLDQVLDGFNLSASNAAEAAERLFAVTQGRIGFTELTKAIGPALRYINELGLDLETATNAMTTLIDRGYKARSIGGIFEELSQKGADGKRQIQELADASADAASRLDALQRAAAVNRSSADALAGILKQNLNAALIDLGNVVLPLVIAEMRGLVGLFDLLNGTAAQISEDAAGRTIRTISAALDKLSPETRTAEMARLREAIAEVAGVKGSLRNIGGPGGGAVGRGLDYIDQVLLSLRGNIAQITDDNLQQLYRGLIALTRDPDLQPAKFRQLSEGLALIGRTLSERGSTLALSAGTPVGSGKGLNIGLGGDEARAAAERAADALAALREQAQIALAGVASEFDAGFTRLVIDLEKKVRDASAAGRIAATEAERLAEQIKEIFRREFFREDLERRVQEGRRDTEEWFRNYQARLAAGRREEEERARKAAEWAENDRRIAASIEAMRQRIAESQRTEIANAIEIARAWEQVGTEILWAANAAGVLDDQTAAVLSSAISLAGSVKEFATEFKNLQSGAKDFAGKDLASQLSVLQAALPVISSIGSLVGSLFGPDPEEQERRELQRENNEQLRLLRESINDFTQVSLSGRAFSTLSGQLNNTDTLRRFAVNAANQRDGLDRARLLGGSLQFNAEDFRRAGISLEDFRQAAEDFNISLKDGLPTLHEVVAVAEALKAAEFSSFAESFSGQLTKLQKGFEILGVTQSGDQFRQLVDLLSNPTYGAPALFESLKGFDVTTAAGRDGAIAKLRELFEGFSDFDPSAFGALNPEDFLNMLASLIALAESAGPGVETLSEAMGRLQQRFTVFETTPVEQVDELLALLASRSEDLAAAFAGADASTAEGRAAIEQAIKDLFTAFEAGTVDLGDVAIPDLIHVLSILRSSFDEAADAVLTLGDRLDQAFTDAEFFGVTDPMERLQLVLGQLGDAAGPIAEALAGIDLSTAEGLAAADAALQALYVTARDGGLDIAIEDLRVVLGLIRDAADEDRRRFEEAQAAGERYAAEQERLAEQQLAAAQQAREEAERRRVATGDAAIRRFSEEVELFDIDGPLDQLRQLSEILQAGAPVFRQLLAGVDLSTGEGRQAGLARLQQFALQRPDGVDSGFFSASAVRQQTLALAELIKAASAEGELTGGSESFTVSQQLTEVTGSRMAGFLGSLLTVAQEQLLAQREQLLVQRAIADVLGARVPLVAAPSLPPASAPGGGGGSTVIQLYIDGTGVSSTILSATTQANVRQLTQDIQREVNLVGEGA